MWPGVLAVYRLVVTDFAIATDDQTARTIERLSRAAKGGIQVTEDAVVISVGEPPHFVADVPRRSIRGVRRVPDRTGITRGVHGSFGRWLVNQSNEGLVELRLRPPAPGTIAPDQLLVGDKERVPFFLRWMIRRRTVKLRRLTVSVLDADEFVRLLQTSLPSRRREVP